MREGGTFLDVKLHAVKDFMTQLKEAYPDKMVMDISLIQGIMYSVTFKG
jgi:hypothetical protein